MKNLSEKRVRDLIDINILGLTAMMLVTGLSLII